MIGFVYAGLQACDLACFWPYGNHVISIPLRYHFDFSIDQACEISAIHFDSLLSSCVSFL